MKRFWRSNRLSTLCFSLVSYIKRHEQDSANSTLQLTKFDVAERQLLEAIRMFFDEKDEVSIRTLSQAAGEVLYCIGNERGVVSIVRDNDIFQPERKSEYLAAIFRSRNFFKHADRDPRSIHEFNTFLNDFSLIDAINMYKMLKKHWTPETRMFYVWFILAYPNLLRNNSEVQSVIEKFNVNSINDQSDNKQLFAQIIRSLHDGSLSLPDLDLSYGKSTL